MLIGARAGQRPRDSGRAHLPHAFRPGTRMTHSDDAAGLNDRPAGASDPHAARPGVPDRCAAPANDEPAAPGPRGDCSEPAWRSPLVGDVAALGQPPANDPGALSQEARLAAPGLELWGGVECTVLRVGDTWRDQL